MSAKCSGRTARSSSHSNLLTPFAAAWKPVFDPPGTSSVTQMPSGRSSVYRHLENAFTPAFAAEYTDQPGQDRRSHALETLMILPYPCFLNWGVKVRQLMM